jgi:hypothetical protein
MLSCSSAVLQMRSGATYFLAYVRILCTAGTQRTLMYGSDLLYSYRLDWPGFPWSLDLHHVFGSDQGCCHQRQLAASAKHC